jgi:RHS repeat-associated protein
VIATISGQRQLFAYDAYGNAINFDPSLAATTLLYSGEQFDQRIALQYLRARYYDSSTGRFPTLDPFIGNNVDPQSLHKYLYVHGDPVQGVDPSGEVTSISSLATVSIIGGLFGALVGGIRGGVTGALWGLATGLILGPLMFVGAIGGGFVITGLAALAGLTISTTTGIFISFALLTGFSLYRSGTNFVYAPNSRERWASGLEFAFALGTFGYGSYKAWNIPKLPPNISASKSGVLLPRSKQDWGTWLTEFKALLRGEITVAEEVTVKADNGVSIRFDRVTQSIFTGALRFIESKFGPRSEFQPNQSLAYPEILRTGFGEIRTDKLAHVGIARGARIAIDFAIDLWNGANPRL